MPKAVDVFLFVGVLWLCLCEASRWIFAEQILSEKLVGARHAYYILDTGRIFWLICLVKLFVVVLLPCPSRIWDGIT